MTRAEKENTLTEEKRFPNLLGNKTESVAAKQNAHKNTSNFSQLRQLSVQFKATNVIPRFNRGIQEDMDSRLRTAGMTEKKVFSGRSDFFDVHETASHEAGRESYFNSDKHDSISVSNKRLVSPQFKNNTGITISHTKDSLEKEADNASEQAIKNGYAERPGLLQTETTIQRSPAEGETTTTTEPASEVKQPPSPVSTTPPEETKTPTPGLIVEDSVTEMLPGQMKKSAFIGQLRASVCKTVEEALSGTIWSVMGCPWIDHWFGYYTGRDSQSIERAIQRYTGASGAASAADYIPIICSRVRSGIEAWRTTGEVKGVPEGVPTGLPEGASSGIAETTSSVISGVAGIFFKGDEGSQKGSVDPQSVQSQLDTGHSLDSNTKSKMESAFGQDFSDVKIHTDSKAGQLSNDLNARAFTIGKDVAFASREYQPGTLIGDALIAHELAHVVQQGGSTDSTMQKEETESGSLEEDADTSAVGAMVSLWGGFKGGFANIARNAMPRLRSGLRLQRCSVSSDETRAREGAKSTIESAEAELKALENAINTENDEATKSNLKKAALNIYERLADMRVVLNKGESRQAAMGTLGVVAAGTAADPCPDEPVTLPLEGIALLIILAATAATATVAEIELSTGRLRDAINQAVKTRVKPIPLPLPMTCETAFPSVTNCATLPPDYFYPTPQATLAALKRSTGEKNLRLVSERTATGGPCPGVGTHYGVKSDGEYVVSIGCCPCCKDTPAGPFMITLCRII
jgi:hypothetical protein